MKSDINKKTNSINKGVWLDERQAIIVTMSKAKVNLSKIFSEVESFHPTGGSRTVSPWGPQEAVSESTYLNRRKNQLKRYYQAIVNDIKKGSNLYILGPAKAKFSLLHKINESKWLKFEDIKIQTSDKLTSNQLSSKVRSHFEENLTRKH